jgi:hypothetical protein
MTPVAHAIAQMLPRPMRSRRWWLSVLGMLATAVLTACGGGGVSNHPRFSTGTVGGTSNPTSATNSSPTVPSASSYSATTRTLDASNYVWEVHISATLGPAEVSTTGQSPGNVMVSAPVTGGGTLANTSTSYTFTENGTDYLVAKVYPSKNLLCGLSPNISGVVDLAEIGKYYDTSSGLSGCAVIVADYIAGNPCPGNVNSADLQTLSVPPQQSTVLTAYPDGSTQPCGVTGPSPRPGYLVLQGIPSANGSAIAAALNGPSDWAIMFSEAGASGADQCPKPVQAQQGPVGIVVDPVVASKSGSLTGCGVNLFR